MDKIKELEARITDLENRLAQQTKELYHEALVRKQTELPKTQEELIAFVKKYCDNYQHELAKFIWESFKQTHYSNEDRKN